MQWLLVVLLLIDVIAGGVRVAVAFGCCIALVGVVDDGCYSACCVSVVVDDDDGCNGVTLLLLWL